MHFAMRTFMQKFALVLFKDNLHGLLTDVLQSHCH